MAFQGALSDKVEMGEYVFRDDHQFAINIYGLHHNPDEWQEPERFIPERFDPASKYYLTPKGTRRHPMSFGPFIGGKRNCLGKTFAEYVIKTMIPIIVS